MTTLPSPPYHYLLTYSPPSYEKEKRKSTWFLKAFPKWHIEDQLLRVCLTSGPPCLNSPIPHLNTVEETRANVLCIKVTSLSPSPSHSILLLLSLIKEWEEREECELPPSPHIESNKWTAGTRTARLRERRRGWTPASASLTMNCSLPWMHVIRWKEKRRGRI